MHIPVGVSFSFFKNNSLSLSLSLSSGMSIVERNYGNASEHGVNEFYFVKLNLSAAPFENNEFSIYTKYLQERFINGKSYVGLGIAVGFLLH
ncbi:MAG: hypothetical protein PHW02_01770 [bacterium]|nr:hypothetical protein [bacterium]